MKKDVPALKAMLKRHKEEIHEFLKGDTTDIYEAFLYEMENHEYGINWDGDDDVLSCFSIDDSGLARYGLQLVYQKARRRYFELAEENEWF